MGLVFICGILIAQVESEQRPHKVSFYVNKNEAEEVVKTLTGRFKELQVRGRLLLIDFKVSLELFLTGLLLFYAA